MKKISFIITLFSVCSNAFAGVVPSSTAYSVARQFMNAQSMTEIWDGNETETKASQDPVFHVFNVDGGGWVIVSGDDCTVPILAYNDTGSFIKDNMPANLREWFGMMRDDILKARKNGTKGSDDTKYMWAHPGRRETKALAAKKVLETAKWDQESPYNRLLVSYVTKNKRGVSGLFTGCVATAMAEVLRYHRWPEHGTGTLNGYTTYTSKYTVQGFSIEDHAYDWNNMPLSYDSSSTSDQKNAVAQLMLDCGVMVEMDYGTSSAGGSGASPAAVVPALIKHMQYSKSAELKLRSDYTDEEWLEMIQYEIDHNGPVLYGGYTSNNSGHQFVCDGYDVDNKMISINWGWSGDDNGFYTLKLSIPYVYTFSEGQMAVFGLVPDRDGTSAYPDVDITMEAISEGNSINGISIESGTFASGETFSLNVGKICNNNYSIPFLGAIKAVLLDKDGNWKEDICEPIEMVDEEESPEGLEAGYFCWFEDDEAIECTIEGQVSLGDRIAFWYRLNDGSWTPIITSKEDLTYPWQLAYVDACFIKTNTPYKNGDVFEFTLIPGNKGISSISWSFDGSATESPSAILLSGKHTVAATVSFTDGTSETITQVVDVN
ncbi:MAG: C10 family peptidase [Bacteroidales bacterium]|nr:C10 family peptidase [Bacteroidales bacterium]